MILSLSGVLGSREGGWQIIGRRFGTWWKVFRVASRVLKLIYDSTFPGIDAQFPEGYKAFCKHCIAIFTNKRSLLDHLKIVHDKPYLSGYKLHLCDECFYVSQNCQKSFKRHKECHELSHVYRCNRCWFLNGTIRGMRVHVNASQSCSAKDIVKIEDGVSSPFSFSPGWLIIWNVKFVMQRSLQ